MDEDSLETSMKQLYPQRMNQENQLTEQNSEETEIDLF